MDISNVISCATECVEQSQEGDGVNNDVQTLEECDADLLMRNRLNDCSTTMDISNVNSCAIVCLEQRQEGDGVNNDVQILDRDADSLMSNRLNDDSTTMDPTPGMSFPSLDDLKAFYGNYASRVGFRWKIRTSKRGVDEQINYMILACSREGNRSSKVPATLKTLPTRVKQCNAKITAKLDEDGMWYIKKVVFEHTHKLAPSKLHMHRVNKNTRMPVKRTIQLSQEANVAVNYTYRSLSDVGGFGNLELVGQDMKNYIHKKRRAIGNEGDGQALQNYFSKMREKNNNFFYDVDLDDDFRVKNVFWVDAKSRATYESFGDVVTFDTTYLMNKFEMPLVAFVGVNHHGHSVLLGCGLLSAEDTSSFVWLFETWLHCMAAKPPDGIVTDQCKAIENAIKLVMPDTCHRWCLWHIMKKVPEKLKKYGEYKKIKYAMEVSVYDTLSKDEFEGKWHSFIQEFDLEGDEWLSELYNERQRWVPVFVKKEFWAGMSTTQRSERIHAFFHGYVNSSTSLQQFVKQYDNALHSKAVKEWEADCESLDTTVLCESNSPIEKQFQSEYTLVKFGEIQYEFRGKMNCCASLQKVDGTIAIYDVLEEMLIGGETKEVVYMVVYNRENINVNCQCLLFEFKGILCKHSLCVLAQERVKHVPSKYILSRWSKNTKRRHTYIKSSYDVTQLEPQIERFDKLCKYFYEVAKLAACFEDATNLLHHRLFEFKYNLQSKTGYSGTCNGIVKGEQP